MSHIRGPLGWALFALLSPQMVIAMPLVDIAAFNYNDNLLASSDKIFPTKHYSLAGSGFCYNVPLSSPGNPRKPLPAPDPTREALKGVFAVEGTVHFYCDTPAELAENRRAPKKPANPRFIANYITAKLYDVSPLLQRDRGFVRAFTGPTRNTFAYTKGLEYPNLRFEKESAQNNIFLSYNGSKIPEFKDQVIFVSTPSPIVPMTQSPNVPLKIQDRPWTRWLPDPSVVSPITSVYEVKTVGGDLNNYNCASGDLGRFENVPYKGQLWIYGNPNVSGLTGDGEPGPVCLNDRTAGILKGWRGISSLS